MYVLFLVGAHTDSKKKKRKQDTNMGRVDGAQFDGAASFEGQPSPKVRQNHALFVSDIFQIFLIDWIWII